LSNGGGFGVVGGCLDEGFEIVEAILKLVKAVNQIGNPLISLLVEFQLLAQGRGKSLQGG